ncbi:MAG TPA: HPr kinase/phosphorylase, partial [Ruminococcaceae bacterium]|nr:HPr kinase/phosphorylase [Oscillospiraceae bacterium]
MAVNYTVPLSKVIKEFSLKELFMPCPPEKIEIASMDVNRPGLELTGFFDYYDTRRILIFGNAETAYLKSVPRGAREKVLCDLFSK